MFCRLSTKGGTKEMRAKAASGKAIIVLCLASFLAGSLFMSRTLSRSYVPEEEEGQHLAKHVSKHLEIQKDCDEHKRVITTLHIINEHLLEYMLNY